jgi:hypothetical protein
MMSMQGCSRMTTPQAAARNANAIKSTEERRLELKGKYPIEWNDLPRTRKEAQELNSIQFFTAKICSHNHLMPRWTSTGACHGCTLMRQREKDNITKQERAQQIINANEERTCPECGTTFLMTPEDRQDKIFCSKACAGAESKRNYVTADPERRREQSARSALKIYNSKSVNERRQTRNKNQRNMGPRRRAKHSVRTRINSAVRTVLSGGKTREWTLKDIGFDVDAFMTHMESLWKPGMSWENYGRGPGKWVRDEIKPMCAFDMSDPEQARECMRLENLRPLWWEENLEKAAKDRRLYGKKA